MASLVYIMAPYLADTIIIDAYPFLPQILSSSNSLSLYNPYLNLSLSLGKGTFFIPSLYVLFIYARTPL